MTATHVPGTPVIEDGWLLSTNPATGDEAGRVPVADEKAVVAAVERAKAAAIWWQSIGFEGRKVRLLRWRTLLVERIQELAELAHSEAGKPVTDGIIEVTAAVEHLDWAAKNAKRVLGPRKVRTRLLLAEHSGHVEYLPFGVVGVIGPWNYPIVTPIGPISGALAAGNTVVFKPSEYTPVVGQWLADTFAEVVPEHPVLQAVHGFGDVGGALCRSGVGKVSFTGSTATGKKVMMACAENLVPVVIEAGGKDALIVDADADVSAAAEAAVWGSMTNAGQTCIGIERVYAVAPVYDAFVEAVVEKAGKLRTGQEIGPITMPKQLDIIRDHIEDALAKGGRAVLGGASSVQAPYVAPTVLVDVPADSSEMREETFGPTLTITKVRDADEAVEKANDTPYGLGGSVFAKKNGIRIARRLRSGMVAVNGTLTFVGMGNLPFGGVGESGFGRIHGEDGLREFARPKAITVRRAKSLLPAMTFERTPAQVQQIVKALRLLYGRKP
ncbi:acyl-CoA reductase-like NAD-dependent aldehyde dehydrogenase [Actinoplanes lutulentus]|uniref:aldehyde dehydrogenase family protein n=1 Tax=Actinoplanes lutulentus TaxID=1287878 RepID=UPI000DB9E376|nr:aldehyde dehydrogenase family protein [Actinoplanes lutulentus]MBB2942066.1 acyl-CoA reductase-like NAD-dependent aldehyde dehydrogenase [Actinoplanes lutulentus]